MQNRGSIIAFATADGDIASDVSRNGRNGLFTSHLISALSSANKTHQRIDDMFMQVSSAVLQESRGKQEPWYNASLRSPYCFGGCQVANVAPQPKTIAASKKVFQDRLRDGGLGPKMVRIPAGSFRMGDIQGGGDSDEKPVHRVSVGKFAMGMYEVTKGEFSQFVNATGYQTDADKKGSCYTYKNGWKNVKGANWRNPNFSQNNNHPVTCVSWNDATAYTKWLSNQTSNNYRLPTEAEWEYAARSETETARYWGNNPDLACSYANVADQKAKEKFSGWTIHNCRDGYTYTAPVGSFKANKFGLYDMLGNLWEWTCSEFYKKYNGKEKQCVTNASSFVLRGGSWSFTPRGVRSASRGRNGPTNRYGDSGFRLVRL